VDRTRYVLGPGDQLFIRVGEVPEIGDKPVRIDPGGYISLPLVGRVRASNLSLERFESELIQRFKTYLYKPDLTVSVAEIRSQPVSVIGAVKNPGVFQVEGRKTVMEVLSLAGGLDRTAGPVLKITRPLKSGRIPLEGAEDDEGGNFSVATLNLRPLLEAKRPQDNVEVKPNDIVSVPRASLIYVTGQVMRSGGFPISEGETITALQALSLAGGFDHGASPKNTRILRSSANHSERQEIAVDLKEISDGSKADVILEPDDILFIPTSAPKKAALRAVEAAIQMGTGVVIWRR
jgi:polysaccharide export outer membrane protein